MQTVKILAILAAMYMICLEETAHHVLVQDLPCSVPVPGFPIPLFIHHTQNDSDLASLPDTVATASHVVRYWQLGYSLSSVVLHGAMFAVSVVRVLQRLGV